MSTLADAVEAASRAVVLGAVEPRRFEAVAADLASLAARVPLAFGGATATAEVAAAAGALALDLGEPAARLTFEHAR